LGKVNGRMEMVRATNNALGNFRELKPHPKAFQGMPWVKKPNLLVKEKVWKEEKVPLPRTKLIKN